MEWDFTVFDLTQYFVRNLPDDEAYRHIRVAILSSFMQDPHTTHPLNLSSVRFLQQMWRIVT